MHHDAPRIPVQVDSAYPTLSPNLYLYRDQDQSAEPDLATTYLAVEANEEGASIAEPGSPALAGGVPATLPLSKLATLYVYKGYAGEPNYEVVSFSKTDLRYLNKSEVHFVHDVGDVPTTYELLTVPLTKEIIAYIKAATPDTRYIVSAVGVDAEGRILFYKNVVDCEAERPITAQRRPA